ncbi:GNAT family N-acetyltransferase [Actinoplanes sp. NPDC049118]|uniref:GNAT family N-acetyltransferase n=1 Tax=Actinoplanes sp. NPDC049118 TaxID=3155769 RepID=UPI0033E7137F
MTPTLEIKLGGRIETQERKSELIDVYCDAYADKLENPFLSEDRHWQRLEGYASIDGYALAEGWIDGKMVGYALGYRLPASTRWWQGLITDVKPEQVAEDGARTFALTYMMVRRGCRRRGYAKELHDALLRGRPEMRATLLVQQANTIARSAYNSWGWYKIGELKPFDDAPLYDAMLRDL